MTTLKLENLTNAQIVSLPSADVKANLKAIINYCDSLLTRSAVIYTLIMTTAEAGKEKPVPFLIQNAFADVWPKSATADKDGNFPLLGFSTVELHVREQKLALTAEQEDAYKKVNAFRQWVKRQSTEPNSVPPAKVLPKKLVDAIAKLRGLIEHASIVEIEKEDDNGDVTIEEVKVIAVDDLAALIETISQI